MSKSTAPKRPQRRPKPMVKKSLDPPEHQLPSVEGKHAQRDRDAVR
jgi:hypothetical protein